jgi:hypothetical protein
MSERGSRVSLVGRYGSDTVDFVWTRACYEGDSFDRDEQNAH